MAFGTSILGVLISMCATFLSALGMVLVSSLIFYYVVAKNSLYKKR